MFKIKYNINFLKKEKKESKIGWKERLRQKEFFNR